jgi:radical SAM protein with 4Fe4S-binding SPASM domain
MLKMFLKSGSLKIWESSVNALRRRHPLSNLFWECTLRCNFNCRHCGSNAGEERYPDELTANEIKNTFSEIAKNFDPKSISISITGGEPLLRKDLFEVMEFTYGLGFNWGMVSNGYLINEEVMRKMKKSGMKSITISIDGLESVHDEFRKCPGSYKKALEAVKMLAKADFLKELNITTTIHRENFRFLEEMYEIFVVSGINSWRVTNIDPIGRAEENSELLLSGKELKALLDFIKEKKAISPIDIMYECGGFLGENYEGEVRNSFFMCQTGITVGSILSNGDIFVCPNVPRLKRLIQGNVRKDRFSEVWNNKFEYFRDEKRTGCGDCCKCEHWNNCLGNAMHLWNFDKGEPKMCHLKMIEKDF